MKPYMKKLLLRISKFLEITAWVLEISAEASKEAEIEQQQKYPYLYS
jgi:hypothetical protein